MSSAKRNAKYILGGATKVVQSFSSLAAETPEVDTLASIKLFANALGAADSNNKNMVVYDSGLCTTGLLSQLAGDVLATDAEIVVDKLESLHALPELNGVAVRWIGLGCVSGEQQEIPDSYLYALKMLWTAIIERAGGSVVFDSTPVTGEESDGLPHVSTVDFPADNLGINSANMKQTSVVTFKEDTFKFIGDKAELANVASAEKALKPVAEYLLENPEQKVLLVGTTAKVGDDDGIELSYQRAETVKEILVRNGVPASQIETIGLGSTDNCLRVEDHNADGSLNEEMAALNRAIYVILSDSTTAKRLKEAQI